MQSESRRQEMLPSSVISDATSACEGTEERALDRALLLLLSLCAGVLVVTLETGGWTGRGWGLLTVALPAIFG